MNYENCETWKEAIETCILDYFARNPSSVEFRQQDIINDYGESLEGWRPVSELRASVNPELRTLMRDGQIEGLGNGRYKLIENERLYLRVQLDRCRRLLQTLAQILEISV